VKRILTRQERERRELWARICEQRTANAMAQYRAGVQAEVEKMARLKSLRLLRNQGGSD
jgi:hypothetical protein